MSFNIEKMILAEAVKAGHIRLKDLTQAGFLTQPLTHTPDDHEQQLLMRLITDGEVTIDALQTKGLLSQETIDTLMELIFDEENTSNDLPVQHLRSGIPTISHYANLERVGHGAMAWVYKGYDHVLQRNVALKVLKVSDPKLIQRFIREARSQAQIEHPNICKIYEAGEFQGCPFIAMQYINGKTLKEIAGELSAEVKVDLMRKIAEAVHEAHRKGLIHRDLKPANIMVEEKDGNLIPYVVDFGLVREAGAPGLTQTDILMGTPSYMSPEQASGKVHSLDRRTDIYSLGVTLYELFSGTLPFVEDQNILILRKIVEEDPVPLRKVNRYVPRDLETIILKCLEKDPEKRYDTAKDLSDDLQRYQNGEAIHAKPSSFLYRLSMKTKRNKSTVTVLVLAFLFVCIFGWIGIESRVTAQKQIVLAQQFGEDVNQIESMMRIARMRPLHDITAEQEIAKKRIEQISREAEKFGTTALGPGEYAIGRGYLVLQDYEKARQHLEKAWRHGYRKSDVALVLAQTLVALYQEKLREIDKINDKKLREEQRGILQKTHRDPALQYLKQSSGALRESKEFTEALIAFMEQRYDVALKKAGVAYAQNGSLYEAKEIEADIHVELARHSRDSGNYGASIAKHLQANKDYLEAISVGRSDASLYEGISFSEISIMLMEVYYHGGDPMPHFKEAVRYSNQALQIYPKDIRAYHLLARASYLMGENELRNGRDPSLYLDDCLKIIENSLSIKPTAELYSTMAGAYWSLSDHQNTQGQDNRPNLQKSIEASRKAIQIDPRYPLSFNLMGLVYAELALYELEHGQDPSANFQKSVNAFQKAVEIKPNSERFHNNLANVYYDQATYEFAQGQDVRATARKSIEAYQKALKVNPKAAATWSNLGSPYLILGSYEIEHGGDPRPSFGKAMEVHTKAQQISPNFHQPFNNMAAVLTALASYEIMLGSDPTATLQKAIENCEKALERRPNYAYAYINLGTSYRYLAESQKKNPIQSLKKADQAYRKSLKLNPTNSEALNGSGSVALREAQWLIGRNKNPQHAFSAAKEAFEGVVRMNPQNVEALLGLAELYRWRGEWLLKTGKSPSQEVEAGLAILNKLLSTHPQMAKAFSFQGVLYLIYSKDKNNPAEKAKLLAQSRQSLDMALSLNKNLTNQFGSYMKDLSE